MNAPFADLETLRNDFPALQQQVHGEPLIYLDNAATTHKPRAVIDAIAGFYERDNSNVHRGVHELARRATVAFEGAREGVAKFVNARSANEIVFTRGTTEAVNLVANSWGARHLKKGDTILLTEMEHHSNIVPWQLLADRTGANLLYIPITGDDGLLDLSSFDEKLQQNVKLFAVTHISNTLGTINPVAELCARARQFEVTTLVDAAQSIGHMPIDVQQIGCDFLAFSGHKMCGPTGTGVLYGREDLLQEMPPFHGGGDMISHVELFKSTWKAPPHKFEAGTPNIAGAIGLHAAMQYLERAGRQRIAGHDEELARYCYEQLSSIPGIRLFGPGGKRGGLVSFLVEDIHAHDVITLADQKGVALRGGHHCNQPLMARLGVESTIRASFYLYNNKDEVDRFIQVLREVRSFFLG